MLNNEIARALAAFPASRPALIAEDESPPRVINYGELRDMIGHLRLQLGALGLGPGQVLPILAKRTPESVALALSVVLEGAAFCFLNESFRPADRRWLVERVAPIGLVVDRECLPLLQDASDEDMAVFRPIFLGTAGHNGVAGPTTLLARSKARVDGDTPQRPGAAVSQGAAHIHFSSGSTGRPKGALGSPEGLLHFARTQIKLLGLTPSDALLCLVPFSNNLGLIQIFTALFSGAALHLSHATKPQEIGLRIRRSQITGITGSTGMWTTALASVTAGQRLLGFTPTLRYITTGGGRMPWPVFLVLASHMGKDVAIHEIYGQAEVRVAAQFVDPTAPENRTRAGSVGRAIPGTTLFVARDTDTLAATREVGEVAYIGPGRMLGYIGEPELSRTKLSSHAAFPGETVIYTGDCGYLDEDGYLYLVGRADRQIAIAGQHVWPGEIEEGLAKTPGVIESVVFGVPDAAGGQQIVAIVVAQAEISVADVQKSAASALPARMTPASIEIWSSLPRTANGKPALGEIRAKYLAEQAASAPAAIPVPVPAPAPA